MGPMVSKKYTNVIGGPVVIGKYSQIGANSIILPNIEIGEGVSVGALSLVNKSLADWGIYAGVPAKYIKERSKLLLNLEREFINKNEY